MPRADLPLPFRRPAYSKARRQAVSKPAPDIFLKACAELGVAPERAYAIEDSYNGIRAAHAGHLLPIMVPDLLPANEEMQEKAEVVLPDLFEVIAYLKGEGAC